MAEILTEHLPEQEVRRYSLDVGSSVKDVPIESHKRPAHGPPELDSETEQEYYRFLEARAQRERR